MKRSRFKKEKTEKAFSKLTVYYCHLLNTVGENWRKGCKLNNMQMRYISAIISRNRRSFYWKKTCENLSRIRQYFLWFTHSVYFPRNMNWISKKNSILLENIKQSFIHLCWPWIIFPDVTKYNNHLPPSGVYNIENFDVTGCWFSPIFSHPMNHHSETSVWWKWLVEYFSLSLVWLNLFISQSTISD